MLDQALPHSHVASLGVDHLEPIEHWPKDDYLRQPVSDDPNNRLNGNVPVTLSLIQALQVGARNSFDYQSQKEDVFEAALDLDLERNEFRHIFAGQVDSLISTDGSDDRTVSGTEQSGSASLSRQLQSGAELTAALAIDLANLLTMDGASSLGLQADATVSIPLLRGSGRHIAAEPLDPGPAQCRLRHL